ncbi:hypothetical protein HYU14_07060 [Candidatus Woesearchaeota archaeon]|nr:hypothetical protein [Candidatus Woesearchaeota archaeon]
MGGALCSFSSAKEGSLLKDKEIVLRPIGDDLKKLFDEAIRLNPKHKLTPKEMDAYNEALLR